MGMLIRSLFPFKSQYNENSCQKLSLLLLVPSKMLGGIPLIPSVIIFCGSPITGAPPTGPGVPPPGNSEFPWAVVAEIWASRASTLTPVRCLSRNSLTALALESVCYIFLFLQTLVDCLRVHSTYVRDHSGLNSMFIIFLVSGVSQSAAWYMHSMVVFDYLLQLCAYCLQL